MGIRTILSRTIFGLAITTVTVLAADNTIGTWKLNMAQSNAQSPEMPLSAVKTGYVDFYLSSIEIAKQLLNVARP